jgi:hypothetical protein
MRFLPAALLSLAACGPTEDDTDAAPPTERVDTIALIRTIAFEGIVSGTSRGFDLDGAVTASGDDSGCGKADFSSPDGTPGIDNAFGPLLPVITSLGGEALQSLVQNAVTSGELLLVLEMHDLATTPVGTCTSGRVLRGYGQPYLDTAGLILPGQTFDQHPLYAASDLTCVSPQEDGSILIDGVVLRLPLQVFDETIDLTMVGGRMRLAPADGTWTGLIAGGVSVAELRENVLGFDAIPEELENGVVGAVELNADLAPDAEGTCTQLSVTMAYEAVPAFLYDGAPPELPPADTATP